MSIINALKPILGSKTTKVVLEISANPKTDGEMVVVAKPVTGPVASNASEEMKQLIAALCTGLKVIGKPEEIEAELALAVSRQKDNRMAWDIRAMQLEAMIVNASKKDTSKGTQTPATKGTSKTTTAIDTASAEKAHTDEQPNAEQELEFDL